MFLVRNGFDCCRVFIGFQWVLVLIQFLFTEIIEDVPDEVTIQLQRMEFIKSKVIDGIPDEIDDEVDFDETAGDDMPEDGDFDAETEDKRCCLACRVEKPAVAGARKIVRGIEPFPAYAYPDTREAANWPPPLDRENGSVPDSIFMQRMREQKEARLAAEQQDQQKQYASNYPAMPPAGNLPPAPPARDNGSFKYI